MSFNSFLLPYMNPSHPISYALKPNQVEYLYCSFLVTRTSLVFCEIVGIACIFVVVADFSLFYSSCTGALVLFNASSLVRILIYAIIFSVFLPYSWFISVIFCHNPIVASLGVSIFWICYWSTLNVSLNSPNMSQILSLKMMCFYLMLAALSNMYFFPVTFCISSAFCRYIWGIFQSANVLFVSAFPS